MPSDPTAPSHRSRTRRRVGAIARSRNGSNHRGSDLELAAVAGWRGDVVRRRRPYEPALRLIRLCSPAANSCRPARCEWRRGRRHGRPAPDARSHPRATDHTRTTNRCTASEERAAARVQSAGLELGLLVAARAATHEYDDALAALGASLADGGRQSRGIVPVRKLRQVVVLDVHDLTLTVRPLAMDDPGLALVTLAAEPTSSASDNRGS
jgi:hypothetical protein